MAERTIIQRLDDILRNIELALEFTAGKSFADYRSNQALQYAVERAIEIISEASRHIPEQIKDGHPTIP